MTSKQSDSAILNLGDIGEENTFSSSINPTMNNMSTTVHTFEDKIPDSALDGDDEGTTNGADTIGLLEAENRKQMNYNFWSLSFYGQFFDVDTEDVGRRLVWSMLPRPSTTTDFLRRSIRPKPDLYGPFWVCVTLVFSVAISGNVAAYLQTAVDQNDVKGFRWHYDFHKVTLAATAVFGYAWLVPAGLYAVLWWNSGSKNDSQTNNSSSFLELLCVYGYSLAIYIPVSVLWTIQNSVWQWGLVLAGAGLSGAVLLLAIWPSVQDHSKKIAIILIGIVLLLHILLACGFMLYFFHVPDSKAMKVESNLVSSIKNAENLASGINQNSPESKNIEPENVVPKEKISAGVSTPAKVDDVPPKKTNDKT